MMRYERGQHAVCSLSGCCHLMGVKWPGRWPEADGADATGLVSMSSAPALMARYRGGDIGIPGKEV